MSVGLKGSNISGKTTAFTLHLVKEVSTFVSKTATYQSHQTAPIPEHSNFHSKKPQSHKTLKYMPIKKQITNQGLEDNKFAECSRFQIFAINVKMLV
jgi:hypothetical protein